MRSWSWTAVWYWGTGKGRQFPSAGGGTRRILTCRLTYGRGGQAQDGAILDVVAILWRREMTLTDEGI